MNVCIVLVVYKLTALLERERQQLLRTGTISSCMVVSRYRNRNDVTNDNDNDNDNFIEEHNKRV